MSRRNDEHRIQAALFKWAKCASAKQPGLKLMFAIPNGGARDAITGAMLKREGVKPGVPDIFLPLPVGNYHGLFIELKTAKGSPSPEQREWLMRLSNRGYAAVLCRGFDEAIDTISRYVAGQAVPASKERQSTTELSPDKTGLNSKSTRK
jgi:hypothetical protein